MGRRARNVISRSREMSLRCAELLDDGRGDAQAAKVLSEESGRKISARTVGSFRKRDYAPVAEQRLERRRAAREVELILESARGSGADFAEAAQDVLAKTLYDMVSRNAAAMEAEDLQKAGKSLAKIIELNNARIKIDMEREKAEAAQAAGDVAADEALTPEQRQSRIKEIFGIA